MEFETNSKFRVFVLKPTGGFALEGYIYGLNSPTHKEFDSYEDAKYWVEKEGKDRIEYIITEIFKKH